jgi:RimJ/RimL family protein N-acetyltransferase
MPEALEVPELRTDRLLLRGHSLDDFPFLSAMWADPNVTRFIREKPFTHEESWARLLRYRGHWSLLGYGYWALSEKSTGIFVGEAGFGDFHRDIEPSLDATPEIGWVLNRNAHGKGYATEAVRAIVAWGDSHFHARRTACIIAPQNLASIRVAEKNGYSEMLRTTYHGNPTILFKRDPISR